MISPNILNSASLLLVALSAFSAGCAPSHSESPALTELETLHLSFMPLSADGSIHGKNRAIEASHAQVSVARSSADLPIRWTSEVSVEFFTGESSDVVLKSQEDLYVLIETPWVAGFEVENTKSGDAVFSSCADYFQNATDRIQTKRPFEMRVFMELTVMCKAVRLLQNAKPSLVSHLPDPLLSLETPYQWPKDFAFVISNEQKERIDAATDVKTWAQADPDLSVEVTGPTSLEVRHPGDLQRVEVIGFGDMNDDGTEDMLTVVRDHVTEATYSNIRLFVMSRDAEGAWSVIQEVHPFKLGL